MSYFNILKDHMFYAFEFSDIVYVSSQLTYVVNRTLAMMGLGKFF